jgi:hypothetical protein
MYESRERVWKQATTTSLNILLITCCSWSSLSVSSQGSGGHSAGQHVSPRGQFAFTEVRHWLPYWLWVSWMKCRSARFVHRVCGWDWVSWLGWELSVWVCVAACTSEWMGEGFPAGSSECVSEWVASEEVCSWVTEWMCWAGERVGEQGGGSEWISYILSHDVNYLKLLMKFS